MNRLMMLTCEAGFDPAPDDLEIREKLTELRHLQKQIGKTGKMALAPLSRNTAQELWQLWQVRK